MWVAAIVLTVLFGIGHGSVTGFPQATWSYFWGIISWIILDWVWPQTNE